MIHTLARSIVSAASAANLSLRSLLDSDAEAGPPPPVLDPTLFWKSILMMTRRNVSETSQSWDLLYHSRMNLFHSKNAKDEGWIFSSEYWNLLINNGKSLINTILCTILTDSVDWTETEVMWWCAVVWVWCREYLVWIYQHNITQMTTILEK